MFCEIEINMKKHILRLSIIFFYFFFVKYEIVVVVDFLNSEKFFQKGILFIELVVDILRLSRNVRP